MKRDKGQMFGIDFTIAIFSFILIMAFIQVHQNRMLDEIREERGIFLHDRLSYTLDNLLVSEGYPKGWNSTNAVSLGLVESTNVLNRKKLEEFSKLNESHSKRLLGIRGTEFYFSVEYQNRSVLNTPGTLKPPIAYIARQTSDSSALSVLNSSGLAWNFYWSGGAVPPNNAGKVYLNGNDITLMKWVIANRTNYSTIIYEDIHVLDTDISSGERDALRGWVNSSGTYIQIQHNEDFLMVFNISDGGPLDDTGIVDNEDPILNATKGQSLSFDTGTNTFDIPSSPYPIKDIVNSSAAPARCIVCKWTYVNGAIYYLPDGNLQSGAAALSSSGLIGYNFSKGTYPFANATAIFSSSRKAILEGKQVNVNMYLWVKNQ